MEQKSKLRFLTLTVITMTIFTSCNVQQINKNKNEKQELPENALCILHEDKDSLCYLTSVALLDYQNPYVKLIGNGDHFLTYATKYKSINTEYDSRTDRYTLHIIPEDNDRFRFEVRLESTPVYDNGENVEHAKLIGGWNFAGYSDEKDNEAAKVFKYFREKQLEYLNKSDTMVQSHFIDSLIFSDKTEKDYIIRLENLYRDDRKNHLYKPMSFIGKDYFFLWFSVTEQRKTKNDRIIDNFILCVVPNNGDYRTKVRFLGRSVFSNGTLLSISGGSEWTDNYEFSNRVLKSYLEHQAEIRTITDDKK